MEMAMTAGFGKNIDVPTKDQQLGKLEQQIEEQKSKLRQLEKGAGKGKLDRTAKFGDKGTGRGKDKYARGV